MVKKTKKISKTQINKKVMTIPQLRKSFEYIESYAIKHDINDFRKEWKKIFGKPITESAAKDYLSFLKSQEGQRGGGAPLTGAPLDYTTRAGADPSTAAHVPPYIQSGFGFANMDSFRLMSGKEDITPRVPVDIGSNLVKGGGSKKRKTRKVNQKGGAFPSLSSAVSEFMSRPFAMNSPPSSANIMTMAAKAHTDEIASPRPENNNLSLTSTPSIYTASSNNEIRTF